MHTINPNPLVRRAMNETRHKIEAEIEPAATVISFSGSSSSFIAGLCKQLARDSLNLQGLIDDDSGRGYAIIPTKSHQDSIKLAERLQKARIRFTQVLFEELGDSKDWLEPARKNFDMGIVGIWDDSRLSSKAIIEEFKEMKMAEISRQSGLADQKSQTYKHAGQQTLHSMAKDLGHYLLHRFGPVSPGSAKSSQEQQQSDWNKLAYKCVESVAQDLSECNLVQPILFEKDLEIFQAHHNQRLMRGDLVHANQNSVSDLSNLEKNQYEFRIQSRRETDLATELSVHRVIAMLSKSACQFDVESDTNQEFQGVDLSFDPKMTIEERLAESQMTDFFGEHHREQRVEQVAIAMADYVKDVLTVQANLEFGKSLEKLAPNLPAETGFHGRWCPPVGASERPRSAQPSGPELNVRNVVPSGRQKTPLRRLFH